MFIPLQQCMGTIRSKFLYQVPISQIAPDYFFRKIKVSRGVHWLGGRKSPRDILHILIVKPIHYENILFRLSADYKVRNAKTCSSENADALSTKQVRYDSHKYDIGSIIEMYEYRTIR